MMYDKRNLDNLEKLAPNTKNAAMKWYTDIKKEGIEILVYETIRTIEKQKEYIAKGASQTMKSYHLVGQALDFVLVDSKGNTLWNAYDTPNGKKVVTIAKKHGFEWGGDWKSFVDKPHLQFNYKGYGTDKVLDQPKVEVAKVETVEAKVMFNDTQTIPAMIKDGRTYVQVRGIAELLGLRIIYDNERKTTKLYTGS